MEYMSILNKISNQIKDEIDYYQFVILDENNYNIDNRYNTYYALVNALSLSYFFCIDPYCDSFKFVNFMKSNTIFDIQKIDYLHIQTKEEKENIIYSINDTINTYKYFNKREFTHNNIILSMNPFYFGHDFNYIIGLNNDKIIDILMNSINVIKSIDI